MELRDVIKSNKQVDDWGQWRQTKMPPSAFPLSRRRGGAYRLSTKFTWRVILFTALGYTFRLLIAFREDICQYEATLGLVDGTDTKVLASLEFHGSHVGWHVHTNCDSVDRISPGIKRLSNVMRIPKARGYHRRCDFAINSGNALNVAAEMFGILVLRGCHLNNGI